MAVRGLRGAITVEKNGKDAILFATEMLLEKLTTVNKIKVDDVASIVFSVTQDLNTAFPALAARELGWLYTPLLCTVEIPVKGSLKKCLRILMHVNSDKKQSEMRHVYLGGAKVLRPDILKGKDSEYYLSE